MRYFTAVVLVLGLYTVGCSSSPEHESGIFLLPQGSNVVVCMADEGGIRPIDYIEVSELLGEKKPRFATTKDSLRVISHAIRRIAYSPDGWIAIPAPRNHTIEIYRYDSLGCARLWHPVPIPEDHIIACTEIIEEVLYFAGIGGSGRESLWFVDLSKPEYIAVVVELPEEVTRGRSAKRIDDLVVWGHQLIAVDNLVFPKYFIYYDIRRPTKPKLLDFSSIGHHGVYESIHQAAVSSDWVVTLSTTSGQMNYSEHIAIYDLGSKKEKLVLSNRKRAFRWGGYQELRNDTTVSWTSIAFWGDTLLIGRGSKGIGVFVPDEYLDNQGSFESPLECVSYYRPDQIADEAVLEVLVFPGVSQIGVVTASGGQLKTTLVSLDELEP